MWSRGGDEPARVGRTADPDADLVELLGMDASTQTAKIRQALGFDTSWNVFSFSRIDPTPWDHSQARIARTLAAALGEPPETFVPRALFLSFAARKPDFAGPMVADVLSETDPLPFDYVAWLRTAFVNSMKDQHAPPTDAPIDALTISTEFTKMGKPASEIGWSSARRVTAARSFPRARRWQRTLRRSRPDAEAVRGGPRPIEIGSGLRASGLPKAWSRGSLKPGAF